jgi:hypothetical protein
MDFELITTDGPQQNDEFDIDLRLGAGTEPSENPQITAACTLGLCSTNSSTCSHTSPKLCC